MKKKRIFSLLLAFAVIMSAAGCQGKHRVWKSQSRQKPHGQLRLLEGRKRKPGMGRSRKVIPG